MNRRAFLGSLSMLAAGMALDPERALWTPGRTTYFDLGPRRPQTFIVTDVVNGWQGYAITAPCPDGWRVETYPPLKKGDIIQIEGVWK